MSKCKYCGIEGEWRQTQYGNRLFVNEEMHKCPNYRKPTQGPQQTQSFIGREISGTYVPQGYVQQPQTAGHLTAEPVSNSELKKMIQKMSETMADMNNSIELIAMTLNVPLPGREPKRASGDIPEAEEGEF